MNTMWMLSEWFGLFCRYSKAINATNARLKAAASANHTCAHFLDCNAAFVEVDTQVRSRRGHAVR